MEIHERQVLPQRHPLRIELMRVTVAQLTLKRDWTAPLAW
jgi:hypothetical protein